MSELHAAAEAAKRSIERTNYTVREYDLIRMDAVPTKEYQDLRTCRDALLALLNDPTSLLKRPEWQGGVVYHTFESDLDCYAVWENRGVWWWKSDATEATKADSLEAAQAACWNDYCERMRGAFISQK